MKRSAAGTLVVGALTLVYRRAVLDSYLLSDDYAWTWKAMQGEPAGRQMLLQGRFLYAGLLRGAYALVHDGNEVWRLRAAGFVLTGVLAAGIVWFASRQGLGTLEAGALAFLVCTLPAAQVSVFFATAFPYPLGTALALAAAALTLRSWNVAALGCLCAAMLVYQSAAMAYVAFVVLALLGVPDAPVRRGATVALGTLAGACAFAWAAVRWIGWLYPAERSARSELVSDLPGKARWFVNEPLIAALNLHRLRPSVPLAVLAAGIIACGLLLWLRGRARRLERALVCLVALPLAYLPNLLVAENWFSYRTVIGLSTTCVVLALGAIRGWASLARLTWLAPAAVAAWGLAVAVWVPFQLERYVLAPERAEWSALREGAARSLAVPAASVCLIPAREDAPAAPMSRSDEFGRPATATPWARETALDVALRTLRPGAALPPVDLPPCPTTDAVTVNLANLSLEP